MDDYFFNEIKSHPIFRGGRNSLPSMPSAQPSCLTQNGI